MPRIILHIDMDAFFAQIEERENPHFKGKPIVVGAEPQEGKGRGVVSTCNYEARKYGIHSALPISVAWRLCPEAIFLPVNMELYERASQKIMGILKKYSEKMERVSLDEAYLDLSFLKNFKSAENTAKKIKKEVLEKERLPSTVGIGPNKTIAKMATNEAKPEGLLAISPEKVKKFLDPLGIEKLPGIGPKTSERLRILNVNKIMELRKLPKKILKESFGKVGESIFEKARGIDKGEVTSGENIKSIGKEHTFSRDTRDSEVIFEAFNRIIEDVYNQMRDDGFSFRTITVVCRFSGFETHTKSKTLNKAALDLEILQKESKKLLLKFFISNPKLIRLVGLRASNFE